MPISVRNREFHVYYRLAMCPLLKHNLVCQLIWNMQLYRFCCILIVHLGVLACMSGSILFQRSVLEYKQGHGSVTSVYERRFHDFQLDFLITVLMSEIVTRRVLLTFVSTFM